MKVTTLGAAAGMGALLGAAWAAPPAPPSAEQLMALALPGWRDDAGGRLQTATLPHLQGSARGAYAGWHEGVNQVLAEPALVLHPDADHLTLIAGLVPAAADGKPAAAHLTPMALAAWRFERRDGAWRLAGSQDVFALRGFSGSASVRAVALSQRQQAVAVEYGSCFQGYCGSWLALYEVDKGMLRHQPVVELALSGINVNGALDCARRLQPLVKPAPRDTAIRDDGSASAGHDCYAIESAWRIDAAHDRPGDLTIRYQGAISRAETHAAAPVAIDQRQVLRYESGRYRAVSGFNPVPPI